MRESGLLRPHITNAPTIAIVDLEIILHLLPYPAQQIHYFERRAEIERHLGLEGDETDLLAFYMATGFNVGELEFESKRRINFANLGGQLEPYLFARSAGVSITKPLPKLTKRWKQLLSEFNSRRFKGWLHASLILLSVNPEDQEEFERRERQMFFNIASSPQRVDELNVVISTHGPKSRRTGVISIGVRSIPREQRIKIIENAIGGCIESEGVDEIVFCVTMCLIYHVHIWLLVFTCRGVSSFFELLKSTASFALTRVHKIPLLVPTSREFSGFSLRFGLSGVAGDEKARAVVVFAVEGVREFARRFLCGGEG